MSKGAKRPRQPKSKFPGVTWNTKTKSWVSALTIGDKVVYLGNFPNEQVAGLTSMAGIEALAIHASTVKFREDLNEVLHALAAKRQEV